MSDQLSRYRTALQRGDTEIEIFDIPCLTDEELEELWNELNVLLGSNN